MTAPGQGLEHGFADPLLVIGQIGDAAVMQALGGHGVVQPAPEQDRGHHVQQGGGGRHPARRRRRGIELVVFFAHHHHGTQGYRTASPPPRQRRHEDPRALGDPAGAEQIVQGQGAGHRRAVAVHHHEAGGGRILRARNRRRVQLRRRHVAVAPVTGHQRRDARLGNQLFGRDGARPVAAQPPCAVGEGAQRRLHDQVGPFPVRHVLVAVVLDQHGPHLGRHRPRRRRRRRQVHGPVAERDLDRIPPHRGVSAQVLHTE